MHLPNYYMVTRQLSWTRISECTSSYIRYPSTSCHTLLFLSKRTCRKGTSQRHTFPPFIFFTFFSFFLGFFYRFSFLRLHSAWVSQYRIVLHTLLLLWEVTHGSSPCKVQQRDNRGPNAHVKILCARISVSVKEKARKKDVCF